MINIKNMSVQYGSKLALNHISLSVGKREFVTIVGKSGCGKTTLLNVVAGFQSDYSGDIKLESISSPLLLHQEDSLFPWLTVMDNIILGLPNSKEEEAVKFLEEFSLIQHKDKYPYQLSGGEKQRISLIRSLVNDHEILLLDEPSSSLDAFSKEDFQDALKEFHEKTDKTIILVTHSIDEAVYLSDTIYVMDDGKFVEKIDNSMQVSRLDESFVDQVIKIRQLLKRGHVNETT